jgi:peroxiredoxin
MKILTILFLFLSAFLSVPDGVQTGGKIENFTLPNAISNQPVSLSDYANEKGVVLIFTSNYCPYSKLYENRIIALANQFEGQGIKFLLINSNTSVDNIDDTVEEMARHAREKGLKIPYLADKEHIVSTKLGATKTPEAFVLQNTGNGTFILKYRGAIDDNPQVPDVVSAFYVKDAITAIINKKNLSLMEKRPIGCMIRKD